MFEVLVFLALIPLAIGGAVILGAVVWLLLPVGLILLGVVLALIMQGDSTLHQYVHWPIGIVLFGCCWLWARAQR
ncbi:MAG: hypothetical protein E6R08_09585 [Nevskiaceae bacterium]|nr:MAG: hypothetical protein E6R08_09585 [Nevskiaceae bacterium]